MCVCKPLQRNSFKSRSFRRQCFKEFKPDQPISHVLLRVQGPIAIPVFRQYLKLSPIVTHFFKLYVRTEKVDYCTERYFQQVVQRGSKGNAGTIDA